MKTINKSILLVALVLLICSSSVLVNINKKYEGFEGQIDMLSTSNFRPECCPNVYTTSSGCLCNDHYEHEEIIGRGGNRTMFCFSR